MQDYLIVFNLYFEMASADSNVPKVKFFRVAENGCALLGIGLNRNRFNANTLIFSFILWSECLSNAIYLCFEVNTFRGYTESIFLTSLTTLVALCYTIVVIIMDVLFNLINCGERIANASE